MEELSRKWLVAKKGKETYVPQLTLLKTNPAVSRNDRIRWGFLKKSQGRVGGGKPWLAGRTEWHMPWLGNKSQVPLGKLEIVLAGYKVGGDAWISKNQPVKNPCS